MINFTTSSFDLRAMAKYSGAPNDVIFCKRSVCLEISKARWGLNTSFHSSKIFGVFLQTYLQFSEVVLNFHNLFPRCCDYWEIRYNGEASNRILMKVKMSIHVLQLSNLVPHYNAGSADDAKKPPTTFEMTKVPQRHPNRWMVFRTAPNLLNMVLKRRVNHLRHVWGI